VEKRRAELKHLAAQHFAAKLGDESSELIPGLSAGSGTGFHRWLTDYLTHEFGVALAFVGRVAGEDLDRIQTLAVSTPEGAASTFEYSLLGSPCANVISENTCRYHSAVAERFPEDKQLGIRGIESYVGTPLLDQDERPLGLIAVLDDKPMEDARADLLAGTLEFFRERAAEQLRHQRSVRELRLIAEGTRQAGSTDILQSLTETLARALRVKIAFIARYVDEDHSLLRTLAMVQDGVVVDNIEYPKRGTPCEHVYDDSFCFVPKGVIAAYPQDDILVDVGAEAYLGVGFYDADKKSLGHVGLIHDRPLHESIRHNVLFEVFAARVGAELERLDSEQRRLETLRNLQHTQRMEGLGVLAGGIAHDFNNLLVSMLGNAELALLEDELSSETETHLKGVIDAASSAAELCRQMLAYAGRGRIDSRPLDLNALIEGLANLLKVTVSKKCRLELRLHAEPVVVSGDLAKLQQVVMNLLTNASEAIGDTTGNITLETGVSEFTSAELDETVVDRRLEAGRYCFARVTDDGSGMDEETLAHIFDPFFTTKFSGRGLGLAALLGIVRGHEGGVLVDSVEGRGTVFTVVLPPVELVAETLREVASPSPEGDGSGTVLVVDDDAGALRIATKMLGLEGFETLEARDGKEAVEMFARHADEVDCVLLDLSMPEMDGAEVFRELRKRDPSVRVILSSGYPEQDVATRFGAGDLAAVVSKPYRRTTLLSAVRRVMDVTASFG